MDWRILYNPLAVLGKGRGLIAALVVVAALTVVAWWGGVHLDGALDLHVPPKPPSAALVIAESLIAWLSVALLLFAASKVFGGNGGAGAHLAAAGLARFPYLLAAVITSRQLLGKAMLAAVTVTEEQIVVRPQDFLTPAVVIGGILTMALVVWSVVILYLGYKEASRIEGGKVVAAFIVGLVVAEIVSKLLIILLIQGSYIGI